jgi:hypothetical protein
MKSEPAQNEQDAPKQKPGTFFKGGMALWKFLTLDVETEWQMLLLVEDVKNNQNDANVGLYTLVATILDQYWSILDQYWTNIGQLFFATRDIGLGIYVPRSSQSSVQWRSQDLHMEGVVRTKRDRHGLRRLWRLRPCWGWVREAMIPSRKGVRGYNPRENFRNLTTLMCILETENFTFVLHVHS